VMMRACGCKRKQHVRGAIGPWRCGRGISERERRSDMRRKEAARRKISTKEGAKERPARKDRSDLYRESTPRADRSGRGFRWMDQPFRRLSTRRVFHVDIPRLLCRVWYRRFLDRIGRPLNDRGSRAWRTAEPPRETLINYQ
jgi:hypothetical protein